jgi:hypothetical protein
MIAVYDGGVAVDLDDVIGMVMSEVVFMVWTLRTPSVAVMMELVI